MKNFILIQDQVEPRILPEVDEEEVWKTCKQDFRYEISTFGRVRNARTKRIRTLTKDKEGYLILVVSDRDKNDEIHKHYLKVHQLVAELFCEYPENPQEIIVIDHIDTCVRNNYYKNLRYISKSENGKNRRKHNRNNPIDRSKVPVVLLDRHTNELVNEFSCVNEASKQLGLSAHSIGANLHRSRAPFKIGYFITKAEYLNALKDEEV